MGTGRTVQSGLGAGREHTGVLGQGEQGAKARD